MTIGVDFRVVGRHKGGMAVYAKNLLDYLQQYDKSNKYILLKDKPIIGWGLLQKVQWIIGEQYWLQVKLIRIFRKNNYNFGFFPNPPVPFLLSTPIILTIADMAFVYDSSIAIWIKWYLSFMYYLSAHKARAILTLSQSSKNDIVKFLKVNPEKVFITPLASANEVVKVGKDKIKIIKNRFDLTDKYILSVPGTFLPRKNVKDLLISYANIDKIHADKYKLVIVGITEGENYEYLLRLADKLDIRSRTVFTGRLSDEDLSAVYSGASLFACTSLYEGFGLPILEAMKCGVPVISYSNSSLPEVVGNAGLLVNNTNELTDKLNELLGNKTLQDNLIKKGIEREKSFTWKKSAEAFITALQS